MGNDPECLSFSTDRCMEKTVGHFKTSLPVLVYSTKNSNCDVNSFKSVTELLLLYTEVEFRMPGPSHFITMVMRMLAFFCAVTEMHQMCGLGPIKTVYPVGVDNLSVTTYVMSSPVIVMRSQGLSSSILLVFLHRRNEQSYPK